MLLILLEGFLGITGLRLELRPFSWAANRNILELFIGALQSEKFFGAEDGRRYTLTAFSLLLLRAGPWSIPEEWYRLAKPSSLRRTAVLDEWASRFERLELLPLEVQFWMGWPCTNKYGKKTWLDLTQMFKVFGADYTRRFHIVCADAFAAGRSDYLPMNVHLVRFMTRNVALTRAAQRDEDASAQFFNALCVFCIENKTPSSRFETVLQLWREQFKPFAENHLIRSGFFCEPSRGFPRPPGRAVEGPKTHVKIEGGVEVRTKWITAFPVEYTNEEALRLKCDEVMQEIEFVKTWAASKSDAQWSRYLRRVRLWQRGSPRLFDKTVGNGWTWSVSRDNPDCVANAAATMHHHGYSPKRDGELDVRRAYPADLAQVAEELALPNVGALVPHMVLLVLEHHEITASFLETLELYDLNGNRTGFTQGLSGYELKGYKRRRGPMKAEQIVKLTADTTRTVFRVLAMTSVVRRYLRSRGDDSWRYLFLSTGRAFGYPSRIRSLSRSVTSQPYQVVKFAAELADATGCDESYAGSIASRFSIPALRAQMVILVYLETRSMRAVAMALGQAPFSFKLVAMYVPQALLHFIFDRWIRVYQTSCIIETLHDSEDLLEASCLQDEEALRRFIDNHTLDMHAFVDKSMPDDLANSDLMRGAKVLIGIDTAFMRLLCSFSLAKQKSPKRIKPSVQFWCDLADRLIAQIESIRERRPDLADYLDAGKRTASPDVVAGVAYD
ncbi:hypothetical protein [Paraburkholderia sp. RAU6.4a]|uniref:hypothetical protein n=1 Tax=Paraburkholderia sp. RAU6.4a TaxID=2991067 RepID=UPI003D1F600B